MMKLVICLVALVVCQSQGFLFPKVKPVDKLELKRYLGRFYEAYSSIIQRSTFQKDSYCTSATYSLKDDGNIKVFNSGRLKGPTGKENSVIGTAEPTSKPGAFIVNFPTAPFKATSPNYLVVKLGPPTYGKDGLYEYSVVSDARKFLVWVLVRDPVDFKAKYEKEVLKYLKDNGYDWFWNKPRKTYQGKDCIYPQ